MKILPLNTQFTVYESFEDLPTHLASLIKMAEEASTHAHSPYSKFKVGAALLLDNLEIITGSNQENDAYPSGLCAERVALFSYGHSASSHKISTLAVVGTHSDSIFINCSPCGGCRQVMLEYERLQKQNIQVLFKYQDVYYLFDTVKTLIPFAFEL
jgi:cytidine deaminase